MFLSDLSIRRPVFAAVTLLALAVLGVASYSRLSISMYPDVDIPYVSVVTVYPGASPESVEREVTKKVEDAVNPIAGVKHVYSYSRESVSTVVVQFELEMEVDTVSTEVRAQVAAVRGSLPDGIEEPVIQKIDFGAVPVVSLALQSDTLSRRDLTTLMEKSVKTRFENLPGVGKIQLVGTAAREVQVTVDPSRLEALAMGVDEVIGGIAAENLDVPLGRVTGGGQEAPLRVAGKPVQVEEYSALTLTQRAGRPVTLGEVATVTDGTQEERSLALVDGAPAVGLDIIKQSGANVVDMVDGALAMAERVRRELPPGVTLKVVRDASTETRDSVHDVKFTLLFGALLTVIIVFLFLNSWRATVITGLTLPISVISSFIVMNALDMSLNMMTLMALSLAIGMLIDDSIVVLENIVRHREEGADMASAARAGAGEIGFAVLATTLSIVAVFVPVAFMKGIVGRFFFQFGITVAFAVLVSLYVSFTLAPMLSSRWADPALEGSKPRTFVGRGLARFNAAFDALADRYRAVIAWALDHRKTTMALATAFFVAGVAIFATLPSSFIPKFDRGEFQVNFSSAPGASMEETAGRLRAVLAAIAALPEVQRTYGTIGAGDAATVRDGSVYVKLVDKAERTRSQSQVEAALRRDLERIPGITATLSEPGDLRGGKVLNVVLQGPDLDRLKAYGMGLKAALERTRGLVDVGMSMEYDLPEYRLSVDREKALSTGIHTSDIARTLDVLVGGRAVSTFEDEDGDAVDLTVRLPEELRRHPEQVTDLKMSVRDAEGASALVPLGSLVTTDSYPSAAQINRRDLLRQVTVDANLEGIALGDAAKLAEAAARELDMEPGYSFLLAGEAEDMAESFGYMAEALILAVVFVYLILAAQFESFLEPLAIMLSLPLSMVGLAGMLALTGDEVSIMSLIGLIMLMGLVTKNAILLVDYAKTLQRRGMERREAVIQAGRTRLRPIVMTTLAMIFGMLPLALAIGAGAEMRAPMARGVVGGLITSTLLTLLVVPVVYTLLDDFGRWARGRLGLRAAGAAAGALAVALALGAPAPASAAEARTFTLEQAVAAALESNRDLAAAREERNRYRGVYVAERAAALPQVGFTAVANRSRDDAEGELTDAQDPVTVLSAGVSVTQPLFTWGKVGAAVRAAREGLALAEDLAEGTRQSVVREATAGVFDVLLAREIEAIARRTLEQRLRQLQEAERRRENGVATDFDVLAARVAADNARPQVIRAANAVVASRQRLRLVLGVQDAEVDVAGTLQSEIAPYPTYEASLALALERRPDLSALSRRTAVARELVTIYRAGDKPRLDLSAGAGWSSIDAGEDEGSGANWNAGVALTWPLFDGMRTQGQTAQARSELESLRIQRRQAEDGIALETRTAVDAVHEAGEIVRALSGTVEQAEALLAMAERGLEFGVKTRLDVQDAQVSLQAAQSELARARRDYRVALVNLELATGGL